MDPLIVVPRHFSESSYSAPGDTAVFDETDQHEIITTRIEPSIEFVIPGLSPAIDAHMSNYSSKITIPRHHNTLQMVSSRISTSLHATLASRKPKPEVKLERLRWRLASGFFAYFTCGWGDGGRFPKKTQNMLLFISRF